MKAVMYGAGNIGRGFIAQRFYLSGYHTTFIDVNTDVVNEINKKQSSRTFGHVSAHSCRNGGTLHARPHSPQQGCGRH